MFCVKEQHLAEFRTILEKKMTRSNIGAKVLSARLAKNRHVTLKKLRYKPFGKQKRK